MSGSMMERRCPAHQIGAASDLTRHVEERCNLRSVPQGKKDACEHDSSGYSPCQPPSKSRRALEPRVARWFHVLNLAAAKTGATGE